MRTRSLVTLLPALALAACTAGTPPVPARGQAGSGGDPCVRTAAAGTGATSFVVDGDLMQPPGSRLTVCLPAQAGLQAVGIRRTAGPTGPGIWRGSVIGDDRSNVTLARGERALAGLITTTRLGSFRISGTLPDRVTIARLDPAQFDRDAVVPALPPSPAEPKSGPFTCPAGKGVTIDLLVAYTHVARDLLGGEAVMTETIRLFVDRLNESLGQSGVPAGVTVRLLHTAAVDFEESGQAASDQRVLMDPAGALRGVHALLRHHPADLVVLLTGKGTGAGAAPQFLAQHKGTTAFADSAFAVVRLSPDRSPPDIFAHEVGHLMGAGHPLEDTNPEGADDWSHGFQEDVVPCPRVQTIMVAGTCADCAPVLFWSHAPEPAPRCPLGVRDERENARTLADTACTISHLRD